MKLPYLHTLSPRKRKLVYWGAGLILGYTLLGFLVLPPIIRAVAVKQLSKQLSREVSIEKVKLNPYALSATIRGMRINDPDGQRFVSWDEVYANLQLSSFVGHPWVFRELAITNFYVRVEMNTNGTFNFSDLAAKSSTNEPPAKPSRPAALQVDLLRIAGAYASFTDLTPRVPFKRVLGPLDLTLTDFHTDPANKNPYTLAGTTDGGEKFSWSGFFYLDPLRSQGDLALENISLNKYAPLYQDFVSFVVKDGVVDVRSTYHFEVGKGGETAASVTNTAFTLRSLAVAESAAGPDLVSLPELKVSGVSADARARRAEVGSISSAGARLLLRRDKDNRINMIEAGKPAAEAPRASGGVLYLLHSVSNAVAMLLSSTNAWSATINDVQVRGWAVGLEDLVNTRPARLGIDKIEFAATNISNMGGTNMTASLSLRWNTNGAIRADIGASLVPLSADVHLVLDRLELRPLDPYLEPMLNLFVLDSKLSLDSIISLRRTEGELPDVRMRGDARLDDFATVDGVLAEDLLKWRSVRVSGIEGTLNPEVVSIKEVAVDDAYARVIIETNGVLNLLTALRPGGTNQAAAPPEAKAGQEPADGKAAPAVAAAPPAAATNAPGASALPKLSIAQVVISNAAVRFTDRSITPNANLSIGEASGTITGLSTETAGHAQLNLRAKVDKVGPVEIVGLINPISPTGVNEIKITAKDVDLTPTSPYMGKFAGYRLAQGKLNLDLAYHIDGRKIKAENVIGLDRFTFGDKVESPDATHLPVRLAVAILKDREGKIKLDVPIQGSLDDPKFRLGKVITGAIVNIVTKIVTSPFAALGAIFGGKGEEISYQEFPPGSAELQPAGKEKLDALVKGLYERPGLQLEVAGSVAPDTDTQALRRAGVDKELRAAKWMSQRKSVRESTTADQITLTDEERPRWIKEVYQEAFKKGELAPPAGETNAPVRATTPEAMEAALTGVVRIGDSELQALAAERARTVREYVVGTGKVEADRVFLAEPGAQAEKPKAARVYLQLR